MSQFPDNLLKEAYSHPTTVNIQDVVKYLNHIGGKDLKISSIRQNLFKLKKKGLNRSLLNRCHLKGASIYLQHLLDAFKDIDKKEIRIVIAELLRNLIQSKTLRLALESRVHGFLGVDYILINNKPINLSKLLKIAKSLENIQFSDSINWDEIEWVNDWLNHFMHRHLRPQPWTIHQAFEILRGLFTIESHTMGTVTTSSIFSSTVVRDFDSLKNEFEQYLNNQYSDVNIAWSPTQEILKGDMNQHLIQ